MGASFGGGRPLRAAARIAAVAALFFMSEARAGGAAHAAPRPKEPLENARNQAAPAAAPVRILSLREALETAMDNSSSIIHSRLRLEGSEARLKAQEAGLKTQLKLTLNPITYLSLIHISEPTRPY